MDVTALTLLWFRPLSPLRYALPESLSQQAWASTRHIPIDQLQACSVTESDIALLQTAPTWVLSSPTAAYMASRLGSPNSIAVMGAPTQNAWREAGGAEPKHWFISPTGESMGLENELRHHSSICVLRSKQGRNDLIETLSAQGVTVRTVTIYEKFQNPTFERELYIAMNNRAVALYLSSTDQVRRILAASQDLAKFTIEKNQTKLLASPLIVSHKRIATAAIELGFQSVIQISE
jgi:uroporphyrinogen-III synthase